MADEILYETEGHVATITMNRPRKHNAMNPELIQGLRDAFARAKADRDVRAVLLTGAGDRAFSAGADLKERAGMSENEVRRYISTIS